jgi:hypothetical protein
MQPPPCFHCGAGIQLPTHSKCDHPQPEFVHSREIQLEHRERAEGVHIATTEVADAGDAGAMVQIHLEFTWPVLAVGSNSNSPSSPGQQLPVMCLPNSRGINVVVVCPTQTFINITIIGMFDSPVGLMWRTAILQSLAPSNG